MLGEARGPAGRARRVGERLDVEVLGAEEMGMYRER